LYANSLVEQRLALESEDNGFSLEYHSPEEIDEFDRRLEARFQDEYRAARAAASGTEDPAKTFQVAIQRELRVDTKDSKLSKEEVRFIQNERALIRCDAAYFMTRYYWILDRENIRRRFTFQAGQKILFNVIAEMEMMFIAIEIILAKARQLGMTTLIGGLELLKVMISEGVGGIMASADIGKTKEMVAKVFYAYDKLQWWIRPLTSARVKSANGQIVFVGTDSKIIFQHGKQTNPIAMGSTPVSYHLSEVSAYPNAEDLIEVGLFKCVHQSPRVFGVLESTCKGDVGWWYDTYWKSKKGWKARRSRLMALFLPFYCGTDMYPSEADMRAHPMPHNWRPSQETRAMIAESELYVQSNDILERVLRKAQVERCGDTGPWRMPREQAWYWEWNFEEHKAKGAEKTWYQEMPHTDSVAFQGSYDNVFGREIIADVWTRRKTSYGVYGLVGQSIEERHEPDNEDIDLSERIVPVTYVNRKGPTYRWELWPLQWAEPFGELTDIRDDESHMGKLFVWEAPVPGYDYAIGVDTGGGTGGDSTCISVARRGRSPQEQDVQVAEWRSNLVGHVEAFAFVMPIAAYYARYMEETTNYREPYVAVEQVASVGDTVNVQMSNMGYARFHKMIRYDSVPKQMRRAKAHKRGWFTHGWSRPILTDGFVILVKNGWYVVNSPYTIREMSQWEVHFTAGDKEKFEHSEDFTDDGIFANAMAGFCPNDTKTQAERTTKQFTAQDKLPALDIAPFCGITICPDGHGVEDATGLRGMMRR
jgi:hypothetical protein